MKHSRTLAVSDAKRDSALGDEAPEDDSWSYTDDKAVPATVTVEPTASNAYGPPIFLKIQRGDDAVSVWLDRDTWEAMYQAGIAAHDVRVELTEQGWT